MNRSSQSLNVRRSRDIDRCCDQFESDWSEGRRPLIDSYLASVDTTAKDDYLKALLELEIELRRNAGEAPQRNEYVTRFKGQEHIVVAVFRSVQAETSGEPDSSLRPQETRADTAGGRKSVGKIPRDFGRYRIDRQIGRGAMGRVFLAEDTILGRPVALKIPSLTGTDDAEQLERFRREAQAAAVLRHSNICPTFDYGDVDGTYYIAMAWIDGVVMSQVIAEARVDNPEQPHDSTQLGEKQIVRWVRKLASAFEEAHRNGIVHRDIKPANVMVDPQGEPIVMDFGLAMSTQPSTDVRLTRTGMQLGSPVYMSPEQVDGDMRRIGPRSDIYSLGVLFYELLTGTVPFDGSVASVFVKIITHEPVPPSELRPGLSGELESLCLRMMSKRSEGRPESMAEVAASLQQFQTNAYSIETSSPVITTTTSSPNLDVHGKELQEGRLENEAELRNLIADISTSLREHETEGLLEKVERVLELQPDNPAMLRLRERILNDELTQTSTADHVVPSMERTGTTEILASTTGLLGRMRNRLADVPGRIRRTVWVRVLAVTIVLSGALAGRILWQAHHALQLPVWLPEQIVSINLAGRQVSDVRLLAQYINLQTLDLRGTQVSDLSPLAQLTSLRTLDLSGTQVSDVRPLAQLTSLRTLDISGTRVNDVSPLDGIEGLRIVGGPDEATSVTSGPDGKPVAPGDTRHTATGAETLTLKGHNREVMSVAFSPDGKRLASASADRTVKVWDAATGQGGCRKKVVALYRVACWGGAGVGAGFVAKWRNANF